MYVFDMSELPLVSVIARGHSNVEETESYFATWNGLLAREEKFAVVMIVESVEDDSGRDNRIANMNAKWIKDARPQISQYCVGISTIAPTQEYRDQYAPMLEKQGQKIYGCPCRAFLPGEKDVAKEWLTGLLNAEIPAR